MSEDFSYVILETSLKDSILEQEKLQSIEIKKIMEQSSEIKKLSDAINESLDENPLTYSSS